MAHRTPVDSVEGDGVVPPARRLRWRVTLLREQCPMDRFPSGILRYVQRAVLQKAYKFLTYVLLFNN